MVVEPVLVTVDPARTAKGSAVPRSTLMAAAEALTEEMTRAVRQIPRDFILIPPLVFYTETSWLRTMSIYPRPLLVNDNPAINLCSFYGMCTSLFSTYSTHLARP